MVYKQSRISSENMRYYTKVIAILTLILVFSISMGGTLAWLTANATDSGVLTFVRNVEVHITDKEGQVGTDIIDNQAELYSGVLPGQIVQLTCGVLLQSTEIDTQSPDAYIRARFEISTPIHNGNLGRDALIFTEEPSDYWLKVDFSKEKDGSDVWYVLYDKNTNLALEVKDGEQYQFFNKTKSYINYNITNQMADKNITINFVVQAFQVKNTQNPLSDINNPTWIWYD